MARKQELKMLWLFNVFIFFTKVINFNEKDYMQFNITSVGILHVCKKDASLFSLIHFSK